MNASQTPYRLFALVDIAATSFAASWTTGSAPHDRAVSFSQIADGFAAFHNRLLALGVPATQILVVLEATGSYWVALALSLHEAGFAVAVVNPAHVHSYALSLPACVSAEQAAAYVACCHLLVSQVAVCAGAHVLATVARAGWARRCIWQA